MRTHPHYFSNTADFISFASICNITGRGTLSLVAVDSDGLRVSQVVTIPLNPFIPLTLASGGGGGVQPPMSLEWPPKRWADRAEILHSLWGIFCAAFGKNKLTGSGQITDL